MLFLRRETTIPIPDVYDFSATTENSLHCPYIVMSFVTGTPLYDLWFRHRLKSTSPEENHSHRVRALTGIASSIAQFGKFSFQTGGQPQFSEGRTVPGIVSSRKVDSEAMLDRWFVHNDPNEDPIYIEVAPYSDSREHYTTMLDLHPQDGPVLRGLQLLLRQFIDWIPDPISTNLDPFVLSHPDFDIQNFLVTEDGDLAGIIDWDGVAAVPRSIGNERYPGWLTRDWDPAMYGYTISMEAGEEPEGLWEDSPAKLAEYRKVYDGLMAEHRADGHPNFCRMSLITDNLAIAAHDPSCRNAILQKMVEGIWNVLEKDGPGFTELASAFVEGDVDDDLKLELKSGFDILISKEGL